MDDTDKSDNAGAQLWWARTQTIATLVGLGVFVLQIWTLLYDRVIRAKALDPAKRASDPVEMGYFRVPKLPWLSALRGLSTEIPHITTIRGLIEAGDEYLWTSAALDHLRIQHGNLSWVPLYEVIYEQIAKQPDDRTEDVRSHSTTAAAISRAKLDVLSPSNERYKLYSNNKLISCVRPLDRGNDAELPPYPRRQKSKGLVNLTKAWMQRGQPCVEISREELVALALILGVSLNINDYTQNVSGVGPFGTGFDLIQGNGVWRLELIHGSRLPRLAASRSSGYSVLFAKHLPFGSLPFAENKLWVRSVYISPVVLQAIKQGRAIQDGKSFAGKPLQVLRILPAVKQIDAFYHAGDTDLDEDRVGAILDSDGKPVEIELGKLGVVQANWCRAVAQIAFGGLVPQAKKDLAAAVAFTLGGEEIFNNKIISDIVDALENLVNKLHGCDAGANIFGDHVTERYDALDLVAYVHYATPSRYNTQEAAAVFSRFMNLMERLVVLSNRSIEEIFEATCKLIHDVYVAVIRHKRQALRATGLLSRSLTSEIDELAARCSRHGPPPNVELKDCTLVIWSILLVWASRVPHGESEDFNDEDSELTQSGHGNTRIHTPQMRRPVSLIDLPQLMAFS